MRTRNLSVDDAEKLYDAFRSVAVRAGDVNPPKSGFYEYELTEDDFKARLFDARLSIALEDDRRKLLAYALAFPFYMIPDLSSKDDIVFSKLKGDSELIYLDQFYTKPGVPAFLVGRILDTWTNLAWGYTRQGVATVIPQKPWKNKASTRFAIQRGFRREGVIKSGELELGVFAKPFWWLGDKVPSGPVVSIAENQ